MGLIRGAESWRKAGCTRSGPGFCAGRREVSDSSKSCSVMDRDDREALGGGDDSGLAGWEGEAWGGTKGIRGRGEAGVVWGDQIEEKCSLNREAIVGGSDTSFWLCLKTGWPGEEDFLWDLT